MDEQQLTSIWQQLQQRLRRYAHTAFANDEDAEDALQDSFYKLWTNRQNINTASHAQALAVTMVKHSSIDAHRKNLSHSIVPLDDAESYGSYSHVSEETEAHETFLLIENALQNELSERERQVFTMKEYDGLSTEEIADRLEITCDAVRKAVSRARQTIRKQYNEQNKYRL